MGKEDPGRRERDVPGFEVCDVFCSNAGKVERLKAEVGLAKGLGTFFKAFADETRSSILYCLSREELCVCDTALIMDMSVQAVSHHLRRLRAANLVRCRREGKIVFYSLDDEHVSDLIRQGIAHVRHAGPEPRKGGAGSGREGVIGEKNHHDHRA